MGWTDDPRLRSYLTWQLRSTGPMKHWRKHQQTRLPTPALQRQLLRAHSKLGQPPNREFCKALRNGRCHRGVVHWVKRHFRCPNVKHDRCHVPDQLPRFLALVWAVSHVYPDLVPQTWLNRKHSSNAGEACHQRGSRWVGNGPKFGCRAL